ncbi:phosphatidylinositol-glycan biosynthesis class X protein [Notolabrus celidotus]|uniref:phosphatidylinositol-glycan biosynthesis class X protein n=1 Tax=Notolabrus celidotus TaxID=1203425 RepID=UPI0014901337|nr:phosphatidylinositol-glycan biosynthesis class X protein [Notolabrus celidotus]
MYLALFSALACLSICHSLTKEGEQKNHCDVLKQLLESSSVSVELRKNGFHRELVTSVELRSDDLRGIRVLLVHRWPRGVYVDPYELSSLRDQRDWQILIDSTIDLELPAHKTSGFVTYVYPAPDGSTPSLLTVTIPVHARYHEPSIDGKTFTTIDIKPPELLLRTEECLQLDSSESTSVVEAPCTSDNSSTCAWLQRHQLQDQISVSLQVPVGDRSLVVPVSTVTLLVTMICCVGLSKYMWKHRIKQ